jgi:hypothetical protein
MQRPGRERRKYPRIETEQMIAVSPVDDRGQLAVGRDLSVGGIRFQVVGVEIQLGDVLKIYFNVEDQTLSAVGRVVWATDVDAFTVDVGLEFLEIDPVTAELLEKLAAA